jgi:hypothetical protein
MTHTAAAATPSPLADFTNTLRQAALAATPVADVDEFTESLRAAAIAAAAEQVPAPHSCPVCDTIPAYVVARNVCPNA